VRSTAKTGDQRLKSQKRKAKSDMIFSSVYHPHLPADVHHLASPKKSPQSRLPLQASTNDSIPSPQPVGQSSSPPSTTTSPVSVCAPTTSSTSSSSSSQRTTSQPMAAIRNTESQQHAPPAGARPSARFTLPHLQETEIRYSPTPAGPHTVRTLQRSGDGGSGDARSWKGLFFPCKDLFCPPPPAPGAHNIRRDVLCTACRKSLVSAGLRPCAVCVLVCPSSTRRR